MRELRSCDFCGDDARGVYEVLPDRFDPAEDEQRRVVLCPACRDALEGVLEPLYDRLGDEDPAGDRPAGGAAVTEAGAAEPGDEADDGRAGEIGDDTDGQGRNGDADAEASGGDGGGAGDDRSGEGDARELDPAVRPDGYGKLLRLLRNRDDAMAREDLESLATNAYGFSAAQFRRTVEAAVENGDLEEMADGLRTV